MLRARTHLLLLRLRANSPLARGADAPHVFSERAGSSSHLIGGDLAKAGGTNQIELQHAVADLERTIAALEDHRSRLVDLAPSGSTGASDTGSLWSDIEEIFEDLMEVFAERVAESGGPDIPGEADQASATAELRKDVSGTLNRMWRRAKRKGSSATDTADRGALDAVLAGLDGEIDRLRAERQFKADELASVEAAADLADREVVHDRDVVRDRDVVHDRDVTPTPVFPQVDEIVAVIPDVGPTPVVDVVEPVSPVVAPPGPVEDVVVAPPVDEVVVSPDVQPGPYEPADSVSFTPGSQVEIGELDGAVYDVNELIGRGVSVADLRRADVPAGVLRSSGLLASDLISAGYSVSELREALYDANELVGQVAAGSLRDAGFSALELSHAGIHWGELAAAGFAADELRSAGADVDSLRSLFPQDFPAEADNSSSSWNWQSS